MRWIIRHPHVITIPKSSNVQHIQENADAIYMNLSDQDMVTINRSFQPVIQEIDTKLINVIDGGESGRQGYKTTEEALENKLNFSPSPLTLARELKKGIPLLKPIRLLHRPDPQNVRTTMKEYDCVGGKISYWSWVICHGFNKPIPAYVRNS